MHEENVCKTVEHFQAALENRSLIVFWLRDPLLSEFHADARYSKHYRIIFHDRNEFKCPTHKCSSADEIVSSTSNAYVYYSVSALLTNR